MFQVHFCDLLLKLKQKYFKAASFSEVGPHIIAKVFFQQRTHSGLAAKLASVIFTIRPQDTPQCQREQGEARSTPTRVLPGSVKTVERKNMSRNNYSPQEEMAAKFPQNRSSLRTHTSHTSAKYKDFSEDSVSIQLPAPFITIIALQNIWVLCLKETGQNSEHFYLKKLSIYQIGLFASKMLTQLD